MEILDICAAIGKEISNLRDRKNRNQEKLGA
jgi:hypothetical protein